ARESADHPSRSSRWSLSVGEEAGRTLTGPVPTGRIPLDRLQRTYGMARTLRVVFRRDPDKDRSREQIQYEGYQVLWPDGRPAAIAFHLDDEEPVVNWCGLRSIPEGGDQWFDLAARPAEPSRAPAGLHRESGHHQALHNAAFEPSPVL